MGHETYARHETVEGSSNRSFGFVFAGFFGLIGLLPFVFGRAPRLWSLGLAAAFLLVALTVPALLAPLNRLWLKFGLLLHRIVSPIALGIMFFLVVAPMGLVMRAMGKDPLRLKLSPGTSSYWIERTPPGPAPETLKDQF